MRCWQFVAAAWLILAPGAVGAAEAPNVLFVFADDWGRYAGAYAAIDGPGTVNDVVRTPNVDRLAREGVLFRNAFVSAPSCTPCRSALVSGQHFWRCGRASILQGAVWDGSKPAFPLLLSERGYAIGETHKVWSPGSPGDAPFGAGKYAFERAGGKVNNFSENATAMVASGMSIDDAKNRLATEAVLNFDAFLKGRAEGKPFFYWFGPTMVHRKWVAGSGRALWGIDPEALRGKLPAFLPDVPEVREDFADYLGEIQALDFVLGKLLERLEATGELEMTMIVVSGDHGAPGFGRGKCNLYDFGVQVPLVVRGGPVRGGRVVDDLTSLTDLAPTFLELAGGEPEASMTGRSLVPVLSSEKSGRVDAERTAVYFGRERHVETARADYSPYPSRAIRTERYALIMNFMPERLPLGEPKAVGGTTEPTFEELANDTRVAYPDDDASPTKAWFMAHRNEDGWRPYFERIYGLRPREELYDLQSDPQQMKNVAGDSAYATTLAELRERLMEELRRTGDPRVVDGGKYYETPPLAGPPRGARR